MKWQNILEMGNGVWAIVALWLIIFLTYHLLKVFFLRWPRRGIFDQPQSVKLAVGVYVVAWAILITRGVIWWGRSSNGGKLTDLEANGVNIYTAGVALGIVGFLCILRTVTRPNFGHWPWLAALFTVFIYIVNWGHHFI